MVDLSSHWNYTLYHLDGSCNPVSRQSLFLSSPRVAAFLKACFSVFSSPRVSSPPVRSYVHVCCASPTYEEARRQRVIGEVLRRVARSVTQPPAASGVGGSGRRGTRPRQFGFGAEVDRRQQVRKTPVFGGRKQAASKCQKLQNLAQKSLEVVLCGEESSGKTMIETRA